MAIELAIVGDIEGVGEGVGEGMGGWVEPECRLIRNRSLGDAWSLMKGGWSNV